jgi:fatty-acid desaturase
MQINIPGKIALNSALKHKGLVKQIYVYYCFYMVCIAQKKSYLISSLCHSFHVMTIYTSSARLNALCVCVCVCVRARARARSYRPISHTQLHMCMPIFL